ncbi:MAG: hypothetical protein WC976_06475 [Caldisericia bacterium]
MAAAPELLSACKEANGIIKMQLDVDCFACELAIKKAEEKEMIEKKWYDEIADAELGAGLKKLAKQIESVDKFRTGGFYTGCCCGIMLAIESNADSINYKIEGFSYKGKPLGDWELTVRKIK